MKKIEDYIHLYCNGKTLVRWKESVDYEDLLSHRLIHDLFDQANATDIKLILRPLDSMTNEERDDIWYMEEPKNVLEMNYDNSGIVRKVALCSERTRYLLSRGFDLFNLISDGLALNRNTI